MSLIVLHPHSALPKRAHLTVDIVAVHGLNGDAIRTWTEPKSKKLWLQDFLPADIDGARVMSFRYNASAAFGNTTAEISDYANDLLGSILTRRGEENEIARPILFISHSLGGIIVKQALVHAQNEAKYESIKYHTKGIVFLATPHKGSNFANYGKILASLATRLTNRPPPKLLDALRKNSETLLNLTEQFITLASNYEIATFYELKPMGISRSLIVQKESAILGVQGEIPQPVTADHVHICRFGARDDATYMKLISRLHGILSKENVGHAKRHALKSSLPAESYNKFYEVPHNVSHIFTGRDDISGKLRAKCLPTESAISQTEHKVFVLYGLGGIGKTQISLKFAQDHRESFWGIFFVDVSNISTADQTLSRLALSCQVGDDQESFKKWLADRTEHWLLVLDNADDPSVVLSHYIPKGGRGTIIITTRNPQHELHKTAGGGSARVDKLDPDEATALLLKAVGDKDPSSTETAQHVVDLLGYIPLAVIHAGAAIRRIYTYEEYCEAFTHRRKDLLGFQDFQTGADYKHTVYATWKVSVDAIKKMAEEDTGVPETECVNAANALDLLNVFGFLYHDDIYEDTFGDVWNCVALYENDAWWMSNVIPLFREDRSPEWDPLPFRKAINILTSYSLIHTDDRRISLHPLVHSCIRDLLDNKSSLHWWTTTLVMLCMAVRGKDEGFVQRQRLLSPHLNACLKRDIDDFLVEDNSAKQRVEVMLRIIAYDWRGIDFENRLLIARRTVEYCENILDEDDPWLWHCLESTAIVYSDMRRWQSIVDLLEVKVTSCLESHTPDYEHSTESLEAMRWLIEAYYYLERTHQALELGERVLAISKKSQGDDEDITLNIEMHLARVYFELGRNEVALYMFQTAYSKMEAVLGEDSSRCLYHKTRLGYMYEGLGDTQKALEIHQQVLERSKKVLSEDHITTLISQCYVARMYGKSGRPEEGISLMVDILEKGEKSGVSAHHMQTFTSELEWLRSIEPKQLSQLETNHAKDKKGFRSGMRKLLRIE